MTTDSRVWELARYVGRGDTYIWSPPWPMLVTGLRFSRPVWVESVSIGQDLVATDNVELCRAHPELMQCELTQRYEQWSPAPLHAGFKLYVGWQISVKLRESVYWAELLNQPLAPRVKPPAGPTARELTRRRHIDDCAAQLRGSLPAPRNKNR